MGGWRMFMTTESGFCRKSLRRYGAGGHDRCPLTGYHDASVIIVPQFLAGPGAEEGVFPGPEIKADPRWPKACACGYPFHPEDNWQVNVDRLYAGAPDGKLYILRDLPPGAVWRCTWMEDIKDNPYANAWGEVWAVQLPCMVEFLIYGKSQDGRGWNVSGELPRITVSPSILLQGGKDQAYHGYIVDGVIQEDCEGRKFEGLARTA